MPSGCYLPSSLRAVRSPPPRAALPVTSRDEKTAPFLLRSLLAGVVLGLVLLPASILAERHVRSQARHASEAVAQDSGGAALEAARVLSSAAVETAALRTRAEAKLRDPQVALHVLATARAVAAESRRIEAVHVVVEAPVAIDALARRYALSAAELHALNPKVQSELIEPGSKVTVWVRDEAALPSSRGRPNRGRLTNGVPMPDGPWWRVRNPSLAWGTAFTIERLAGGLSATAERFGSAPVVMLGDISARRGGRLRPHLSHQSGRDVDMSYYRLDGQGSEYFRVTRPHELDVARQWFLLRHWIKSRALERAFVDPRLSRVLVAHALRSGDNPRFLDEVFGTARLGRDGIIAYSPGHDDHIHLRFRCGKHDASCHDL